MKFIYKKIKNYLFILIHKFFLYILLLKYLRNAIKCKNIPLKSSMIKTQKFKIIFFLFYPYWLKKVNIFKIFIYKFLIKFGAAVNLCFKFL